MRDADAVRFLQWALPQLGLRWRGFRNVRRQVRRRIARRLADLSVPDLDGYRDHLAAHPEEWRHLDGLCRVSISRLYRDRSVFTALADVVLPVLAERACARNAPTLRCWSAGCASGEEPYTLSILWTLALADRFPGLVLDVTASDTDSNLLARSRAATYPSSSLRELPVPWREAAFRAEGEEFRLRERFRTPVRFEIRDVRAGPPEGCFDLVLCRNLAFTYFQEAVQRDVLTSFGDALVPGGALVLGMHESIPDGATGFSPWDHVRSVLRRDPVLACALRGQDDDAR